VLSMSARPGSRASASLLRSSGPIAGAIPRGGVRGAARSRLRRVVRRAADHCLFVESVKVTVQLNRTHKNPSSRGAFVHPTDRPHQLAPLTVTARLRPTRAPRSAGSACMTAAPRCARGAHTKNPLVPRFSAFLCRRLDSPCAAATFWACVPPCFGVLFAVCDRSPPLLRRIGARCDLRRAPFDIPLSLQGLLLLLVLSRGRFSGHLTLLFRFRRRLSP